MVRGFAVYLRVDDNKKRVHGERFGWLQFVRVSRTNVFDHAAFPSSKATGFTKKTNPRCLKMNGTHWISRFWYEQRCRVLAFRSLNRSLVAELIGSEILVVGQHRDKRLDRSLTITTNRIGRSREQLAAARAGLTILLGQLE